MTYHDNTAAGDIAAVLSRYLDIQKHELALREEKAGLQEKIAAHMKAGGSTVLSPDLNGEKLKVKCTPSVSGARLAS